MIERTHQAQSVQTTRAVLQQVAAASHGLALPPPNLGASPSLSVDVAIPEEGEGDASDSTLGSTTVSAPGAKSVVSASSTRTPRDFDSLPPPAAAAAAQPSPNSVDIGPLGFASVDEFEQQRSALSSGAGAAESIGDRGGWRRRSGGAPLPPAADVRLASVIGSAMHAREQVHASQLARGSLTRDAAGDIILQPPLGGSRVIESGSSDAPSELMQDVRSRTANAVARATSSAALSSIGGTSDDAGASLMEGPRTPATGDHPSSRSAADPAARSFEGSGPGALTPPFSPENGQAATSPGSAPLPADHAAAAPDCVRAYPDTDPARPLRLGLPGGRDPVDTLPSALMLGSPTARSPASPSLLPASEIDSAADRDRSDTAHMYGASRELEAEFSAITGEFQASYDTGILSPQGEPSDTVTMQDLLSPPPSGGPSSGGSNGIAQSSRSLRAWTSAVPLSPTQTSPLRLTAAQSQSPQSSVDLELPRLPGAPPRAVLATVEAARLVAAEGPSPPRRDQGGRLMHIRDAYAAPVPPTVMPPALAQPASPSRADFDAPLTACMQPVSPPRWQPASPARGQPGSPPPQPNLQPPQPPLQRVSPPLPQAAPAALPAPLNSWSRAAFNFVRQPLVRQPASGRPVSHTSTVLKPPTSAYPISPQYQAPPAASLAPITQPPSPPSPSPIASTLPATAAAPSTFAAPRQRADSRSPSVSPRNPNSPPSATVSPNGRHPPTSPTPSPRCLSVRGASSSSLTHPSNAPSMTPSVVTSVPSVETTFNAEMSDPSQGGWSSRLDFTPPSFADTTDAAAGLAGTVEPPSATPPAPCAGAPLHWPPVPPVPARASNDNGAAPAGTRLRLAPKSLDSPTPQPPPMPYGAKQPRSEDPSPRGPASLPRGYRKPNRHKWASAPYAPGAPQSDRLPLLPSAPQPAPPAPPGHSPRLPPLCASHLI